MKTRLLRLASGRLARNQDGRLVRGVINLKVTFEGYVEDGSNKFEGGDYEVTAVWLSFDDMVQWEYLESPSRAIVLVYRPELDSWRVGIEAGGTQSQWVISADPTVQQIRGAYVYSATVGAGTDAITAVSVAAVD
jgi:hypothetical protein